MSSFVAPISEEIWDSKYRFKRFDGTIVDRTVEETWRRIARALASKEKNSEHWEQKFYEALSDFKFLPAGRIVAGAGTGRDVTLFNCFVMGTIPDSMDGIFEGLKEAALTMQQGGGIGYDFSTIRPSGAEVRGVESNASGPLSFMDVWNSMCRTIMSAGSRRGAMMATMRCDHPDIEAFVRAKQDSQRLRMFNVSVLVTDAFMKAVREDAAWHLVFGGKIYKTIQARDLWDQIMRSTYDYAEPGVIFIDRINQKNNLNYCETISATNPCGEQPLPPYGACLLGSINLTRFVRNPFRTKPGDIRFDTDHFKAIVRVAVRMLDNVIDNTKFPLDEQLLEAKRKRRIGLGVTGLADTLIMLGIEYGSDEAVRFTNRIMCDLDEQAYLASSNLAAEKGSFLDFSADAYLASGTHASTLHENVQETIRRQGIRNSHLTSIAPTGTISLYAGNVSSGIEPVFAHSYTRKVLQPDGSRKESEVASYSLMVWRELHGDAALPDYFVTAQTLPPIAHVRMQAAAQEWVDSSISKTVNLPADINFEDFKEVYAQAFDLGCKGCTTYRPNSVTGSVLEVKSETKPADPAPKVQVPVRPEALSGSTYKTKWPGERHAIYVTINDDADGRPFEIFFSSIGAEHSAWTSALSRMISAVFRRGGDFAFVAEELKEIVDPKGGGFVDGQFVPSLVAQIGRIIERHTNKRWNVSQADMQDEVVLAVSGAKCQSCGEYAVIKDSGCEKCQSCGHSKCG